MSKSAEFQPSLSQRVNQIRLDLDELEKLLAQHDPIKPPRQVTAEWVRSMLQARRRRERAFPAGMFSDPAWDMLLALYAAALAGTKTRIIDVARQAAVAETTALRWIDRLSSAELIDRVEDKDDKRQVFVSLSHQAREAMDELFRDPQAAGRGI